MLIELVLAGLAGAAGTVLVARLRGSHVAKLDFPGLQPAEDRNATTRYFEHEGVECWVRSPEPGWVTFGLVGVINGLERGRTLEGTTLRGAEFQWRWTDNGAPAADTRFLPAYPAAKALVEVARRSGFQVFISLTWNGYLQVRVRRPTKGMLPELGRALVALSREMGLEPRIGMDEIEPPDDDAANAPSGASVGAPGLGRR